MKKNVSDGERLLSLAVGGMGLLLARRLRRQSGVKAALGGAVATGLLWRGASGQCAVYQRLGIDTAQRPGRDGEAMVRSLVIAKPLAEVAGFLRRDLSDRFEAADEASHFRGRGALASWTLTLTEVAGGRGTRIAIEAAPDVGSGARLLAALHATAPVSTVVEAELRNIKALVETGEIATTVGQSHGQRSGFGHAVEEAAATVRERVDALAGTVPALGAQPARHGWNRITNGGAHA